MWVDLIIRTGSFNFVRCRWCSTKPHWKTVPGTRTSLFDSVSNMATRPRLHAQRLLVFLRDGAPDDTSKNVSGKIMRLFIFYTVGERARREVETVCIGQDRYSRTVYGSRFVCTSLHVLRTPFYTFFLRRFHGYRRPDNRYRSRVNYGTSDCGACDDNGIKRYTIVIQ